MKQHKVSFNDDQKGLFDELKNKKLISQDFNNFVRDAFHDKIDEIRTKRGLMCNG